MTIAHEIAYAAHTASCTFLLDEEGICRRIVLAPRAKRRESSSSSAKCVGAQYVASLDAAVAGCLVELPRIGVSMLFARVDSNGRISLVRTGVVTRFESQRKEPPVEDPFVESVDSRSVETSAPVLDTLQTPPKTKRFREESREIDTPRNVAVREILESRDPDYQDVNDRTQRIPALRPEDIAKVRFAEEDSTDDLETELATAQWRAVDHRPPPRVNESGPISAEASGKVQIRQPLPSPPAPESRGVLPRRDRAARAYLTEPARSTRLPQPQDPERESERESEVVMRRKSRG